MTDSSGTNTSCQLMKLSCVPLQSVIKVTYNKTKWIYVSFPVNIPSVFSNAWSARSFSSELVVLGGMWLFVVRPIIHNWLLVVEARLVLSTSRRNDNLQLRRRRIICSDTSKFFGYSARSWRNAPLSGNSRIRTLLTAAVTRHS